MSLSHMMVARNGTTIKLIAQTPASAKVGAMKFPEVLLGALLYIFLIIAEGRLTIRVRRVELVRPR